MVNFIFCYRYEVSIRRSSFFPLLPCTFALRRGHLGRIREKLERHSAAWSRASENWEGKRIYILARFICGAMNPLTANSVKNAKSRAWWYIKVRIVDIVDLFKKKKTIIVKIKVWELMRVWTRVGGYLKNFRDEEEFFGCDTLFFSLICLLLIRCRSSPCLNAPAQRQIW